jgi:hypothetical protein
LKITIIGGGPAGLKAAEVAAQGGAHVTLYEGKPSVGRKFLVAGHGGLNLTHSEPIQSFAKRYEGSFSDEYWTSLLSDFGNKETQSWAQDLDIQTFIGTSGRIFPKEFKAAPLLRSWVRRLRKLGVCICTRHSLSLIRPKDGRFNLTFSIQEGFTTVESDALILALGGASWPETGSDAKWVTILESLGVPITPFAPANCGWEVNWNAFLYQDILRSIEGQPIKNLTVRAGPKSISGELLVTKYGLEGGSLYQLGSTLRGMEKPVVHLDLKPTFNINELASKIIDLSGDIIDRATKAWRLTPTAAALLRSAANDLDILNPLTLATLAKDLPIPLSGPRPIEEAISSAGGVSFGELDEHLMVKRYPGLFLAGEMIDWEAPTGGYLLQGCFATGTRAARGALSFLKSGT